MKHFCLLIDVEPVRGFPGSSAVKESACSAGDPGQFLAQKDPLEKR